MDAKDILIDAVGRPLELIAPVLDGLTHDVAHAMPQGANSIAWLVWHAARQMDVQTVHLSGSEEVWVTGNWARRLGVERVAGDFGLGDTASDVAALRVTDPAGLGEYLQACVASFISYVRSLSTDALAEVIDESYTPAVTRGVRLVSIIDDAAIHAGQAAYARGLLEGWSYGV